MWDVGLLQGNNIGKYKDKSSCLLDAMPKYLGVATQLFLKLLIYGKRLYLHLNALIFVNMQTERQVNTDIQTYT